MFTSDEEFDKKLERIFDDADLREEDRTLWRERLSDAGDYLYATFVDVFSKDRDLLVFFTGNMRKRIEANGDQSKLDEIAEEEKAYFSGLMKKNTQ